MNELTFEAACQLSTGNFIIYLLHLKCGIPTWIWILIILIAAYFLFKRSWKKLLLAIFVGSSILFILSFIATQ